VNQKALNCQTIPEGMKESREICAHNSRIQFIKLIREGNGGNGPLPRGNFAARRVSLQKKQQEYNKKH